MNPNVLSDFPLDFDRRSNVVANVVDARAMMLMWWMM